MIRCIPFPSRSSSAASSGLPARRAHCCGRTGSAARGFTLIEVMIVVVIMTILAAVAYPSYVNYVIRGQRSEAQQWLLDFAQRQEQYFLDRRAYATAGLGAGANQLPMAFPEPGTSANLRYNAPAIAAIAGPPPGYVACLQPLAGGSIATAADGGLCVDATGLRWRDMNTNGSFDAGTDLQWTAR